MSNTNLDFYTIKFFYFPKLKQIITFIDKKKQKKIVSVYCLFVQIKMALIRRSKFSLCYCSQYSLSVLFLLKQIGFVLTFYSLSIKIYKIYLRYSTDTTILNKAVIIVLSNFQLSHNRSSLKLISSPSRQVFVTFQVLLRLVRGVASSKVFLLNTSKGLITHFTALNLRIGGVLLCAVE